MKYFVIFSILIVTVFTTVAYGQSQEITTSEERLVPYTENSNVGFTFEDRIDYDFIIAKIMPDIFEQKFFDSEIIIDSEDVVLNRGPRILGYLSNSYNCGYVIDKEENKVYWLEAAINSTHIQYANFYTEIPREGNFEEMYLDCFYPLEIEVAEYFLKEKSYFTPDEEARVVASVKHELRGNDVLNKYQFKIGKFNLDYKDVNILPFCGMFEGKMAGSKFFVGTLNGSGQLAWGLESKMSSICAIDENATLYDAKFKENSDRDKLFQSWQNKRQETVFLKPTSVEKLLERNYLYVDFINHTVLGYASHLKLVSVDYQPESSNTVLKFTLPENDSYMKIRLRDDGAHYYMAYGNEDWSVGRLLEISILIDDKKINYTQFPYVRSPEAPYPSYFTDLIFKVPTNSTTIEIQLDIENYNFNPDESDGEWRDY